MYIDELLWYKYFTFMNKTERNSLQREFNPLQPDVAFLYPLKTSENLKVF